MAEVEQLARRKFEAQAAQARFVGAGPQYGAQTRVAVATEAPNEA